MTRDEPTIKKISASELRHLKERGFVRRSDLYRYLAKNYLRLVEQKVGTGDGPSWDETAAVVSRCGFLGARGAPLNGNSVRRVFRRVEQDIRRREADAASKDAKSHRSRQRGDWQPPIAGASRHGSTQVAPVQATVPTTRGYDLDEDLPPRRSREGPAETAPAKKMTIEDLSPEGRAQIERIRRDFAETDRKRFGSF